MFSVPSLPNGERAQEVVEAIRVVLRKHGIDESVAVTVEGECEVVGKTTPHPIIVSRLAGEWTAEVEADIAEAARGAEPSAVPSVSHHYPDQDDVVGVLPADGGTFTWVAAVAFDSTGTLLAAAHQDGTVRIWDTVEGRIRHRLSAHDGRAESLAFSPDGRHLVTGGDDHKVRIWDVETGSRTEAHTPDEHHRKVTHVAYHPDGRRVASASHDGKVRIWDTAGDVQPVWLSGHREFVDMASFHPDGRLVASAGHDKKVRIWNVETGRCLRVVRNNPTYATAVAYSPTGEYLAAGSDRGVDDTGRGDSDKGRVVIWDGAGKSQLVELTPLDSHVRDLAFSPDGRELATVAFTTSVGERQDRQSVQVWAVPSGELLRTVDDPGGIASMALSADGRRLATGDIEGFVTVRDLTTGEIVQTLPPRAG
ncbi:WD40 repeat domain-containing protein [Frankia sp. Mgl5]|uniref:WD40 repeat domain-containing protein n=1 Tax=Frankia sp. Mgl5 TaxID=2933793 RepID=UPI00200EAA47|nr:WD40 repeat domain-containing protein [Frankia sp. Mgl5]MCK9931445.1 WD40 repeat domain-containing protein [Frankia sp. Mgl5]